MLQVLLKLDEVLISNFDSESRPNIFKFINDLVDMHNQKSDIFYSNCLPFYQLKDSDLLNLLDNFSRDEYDKYLIFKKEDAQRKFREAIEASRDFINHCKKLR